MGCLFISRVKIKYNDSFRVLPSDMLLRIWRKHMSRFLISSRSSLSQRSTVLPRADAHWFWCPGKDREQSFSYRAHAEKSNLQRDKESHSNNPNFRDGAHKSQKSCSSPVLWDSNINCRFEEIRLQLHYSIWGPKLKRLWCQHTICIGKKHTHSLMWDTQKRRMLGGTLGGFWLYCTDICKPQSAVCFGL